MVYLLCQQSKKRKQKLILKVLQLYATGNSYLTISEKVGISTWSIQRILSMINQDASQELKTLVTSELGLQVKASIVLLRGVIKTCEQIIQTTKNESIKMGALHLQVDCLSKINLLYADS